MGYPIPNIVGIYHSTKVGPAERWLTVQWNKFCCHSLIFYNIRLKGSMKRVLYQLAQQEIQLTHSGQSNATNDTLPMSDGWMAGNTKGFFRHCSPRAAVCCLEATSACLCSNCLKIAEGLIWLNAKFIHPTVLLFTGIRRLLVELWDEAQQTFDDLPKQKGIITIEESMVHFSLLVQKKDGSACFRVEHWKVMLWLQARVHKR